LGTDGNLHHGDTILWCMYSILNHLSFIICIYVYIQYITTNKEDLFWGKTHQACCALKKFGSVTISPGWSSTPTEGPNQFWYQHLSSKK
jgi:hypothetical protein